MSEQLMGVDYFPLETDIKDDDKIFALKYRFALDEDGNYDNAAAFAAYGRFVELLASIYHEGFAIELTQQKCLRLSQQLGMSLAEFKKFASACVEVGLFDSSMYEQHNVLTSRGIQNRYFHAVKRRKGDIPQDMKAYVIASSADTVNAQCLYDENSVHTSCEHDADTMSAAKQQIIKKNIKEDNKKEEDKKTRKRGSSSSSKKSNSSQNLLYPLSCFSMACTDGRVFNDHEDKLHETPWDALCSRFSHATDGQDMGAFARKVSAECPADCKQTPEQVTKCYYLLCSALDKFDPSKCASPVPLALAVLKDRVICDD